jgi:hypothetical protein
MTLHLRRLSYCSNKHVWGTYLAMLCLPQPSGRDVHTRRGDDDHIQTAARGCELYQVQCVHVWVQWDSWVMSPENLLAILVYLACTRAHIACLHGGQQVLS